MLTLSSSTSNVSGSSIATISGENVPVTIIMSFTNETEMFATAFSAPPPKPGENTSSVLPKSSSDTAGMTMSNRGSSSLERLSMLGVIAARVAHSPINWAGAPGTGGPAPANTVTGSDRMSSNTPASSLKIPTARILSPASALVSKRGFP